MHYEDKKTGFKFDAVSGVPKENTVEAFEELFSANKATEEGELPELPQEIEVGGEGWDFEDFKSQKTFSVDHMHEYARQAIAADRAFGQVANKAEVEPNGWIATAVIGSEYTSVAFRNEKVARACCVKGEPFPFWKEPVATPPATTGGANATPTGASTAPEDVRAFLEEMKMSGKEMNGSYWIPRAAKLLEAWPIGASTVLTDERIAAIWHETACAEGEGTREHPAVFARAIEREVEAQAGQNCFLSWGGKNVHGDEASIKAVKAALHDAGTVPELKDRIRDLQAQAGQVAVPENKDE